MFTQDDDIFQEINAGNTNESDQEVMLNKTHKVEKGIYSAWFQLHKLVKQ